MKSSGDLLLRASALVVALVFLTEVFFQLSTEFDLVDRYEAWLPLLVVVPFGFSVLSARVPEPMSAWRGAGR